ncbi:DC-STAMP domain-containing protein 2 [Morone saxatilis]|uniref:DC-STAMP domain-containing protein 2 n=1 Tax=Morone saxatilis TaxID=34816 RepID=UPI0015E216B5|nr:DC-STAMP domain-containing protein 2 [Morone saxatilis]
MKSEKRTRHRMETDVKVQVKKGGVTQAVRGVLNRSAGRSHRSSWRKVKGHLSEEGRSLVAFVFGLLLASLYGVTALFLQKQPLWLCVYTTLAVAVLAAFGMGLSAGIRADVMVMLPSLCSAHGRNFLLFLFASVLLSGPLANTLENTERAAASLLCGAELAANQTQELMQRAATPLFSVLDRIREISSNALSVAGRVQNLIGALTDSVRHVARTLRNVLHFLVDIGDVCNVKLGSPYRKCREVFAEAQADCSDLLGEFNFLCDIVDGFLPLCNLARAGELFCLIPSYIAEHLKKHLAAPTVAAFQRMKREFEFNISASMTFDLDANSSHSVQQVSQDIMEEVSSELHVFEKLREPLTYAGLVLLACSFLRAVRYRRRYLQEVDFDNVYISTLFEELDQQVASGGGASVLPITCREAKTYITPLSSHLTARERRAVLVGVVSVLRNLVMGGLLVALDFLVFWTLDQVHHQVTGDVVARAPVTVAVQVNGSGYASDIFRDLVASFNILQGANVTVVSRKCLLQPSEPNYITCFLLGFLLGLALLVSLSGGFMRRCKRLVCASYHPERELLLAVSGPFQSWSPVRQSVSQSSFHRVDLLLGTSEHDGLIGRARRIKDFEALQGRTDGKTAFYEALSRSLGGVTGSDLLKEAAAWFYSLDHSPSAAGYNLFSRALNNATRDLFIICPSLQMASHWANSKANVFLYHQPATSAHNRAEANVPLDVQFVFGTPHHPMSSQRFTSSDRRLSLAMMTYVSSFVRTGNPNPSRVWAASILPRWQQVLSSEALPTYLQLRPTLQHHQGLSQSSCTFWSQLGTRLTSLSGETGAEPVRPALTPELPVAAPSSQSQTEKDAYS